MQSYSNANLLSSTVVSCLCVYVFVCMCAFWRGIILDCCVEEGGGGLFLYSFHWTEQKNDCWDSQKHVSKYVDVYTRITGWRFSHTDLALFVWWAFPKNRTLPERIVNCSSSNRCVAPSLSHDSETIFSPAYWLSFRCLTQSQTFLCDAFKVFVASCHLFAMGSEFPKWSQNAAVNLDKLG